jgi:magnesium-transporting ATPase (P-type)
MIDPARPEAREAVAMCKTAGIRPVTITGDHPITALAIARELGIAADGSALTCPELDRLPAAEPARHVDEVALFARVTPEHKRRIVQALQQRVQIVAMTGDGVNDGPALKAADIGVVMDGWYRRGERSRRSASSVSVCRRGRALCLLGMSTLAYFDGCRSDWLPANLIQAQRDYFGAHTYGRVDAKGVFHTRWSQE